MLNWHSSKFIFKNHYMRLVFFIVFIPFLPIHSQELHHQMLSAQGKSTVLANGTYVSQTIGQQSVIGNYTRDGKTYGQGFQQSMWGNFIKGNAANTITDKILVELFDVRGRLVFSTSQQAEGTLLTVISKNGKVNLRKITMYLAHQQCLL